MLVKYVSFVTLITFNVNAVDWSYIQLNGPLPDIPIDNCTVREYYKFKCNVCECVSPSTLKCGTLRCADDSDMSERSANVKEEGCAIGTIYRDWCNLCRCKNGNSGGCTRMRCRHASTL